MIEKGNVEVMVSKMLMHLITIKGGPFPICSISSNGTGRKYSHEDEMILWNAQERMKKILFLVL